MGFVHWARFAGAGAGFSGLHPGRLIGDFRSAAAQPAEHKKTARPFGRAVFLPSMDTQRAAPEGAERATHEQNSTGSTECQARLQIADQTASAQQPRAEGSSRTPWGGPPQAGRGREPPGRRPRAPREPPAGAAGAGGKQGRSPDEAAASGGALSPPLVVFVQAVPTTGGPVGTRCARFRCAAGMPRVVRAGPGGGCGAAVGLRGCKVGPEVRQPGQTRQGAGGAGEKPPPTQPPAPPEPHKPEAGPGQQSRATRGAARLPDRSDTRREGRKAPAIGGRCAGPGGAAKATTPLRPRAAPRPRAARPPQGRPAVAKKGRPPRGRPGAVPRSEEGDPWSRTQVGCAGRARSDHTQRVGASMSVSEGPHAPGAGGVSLPPAHPVLR